MKEILSEFSNKDGKIIFEYDISRLGKRIDVVLLLEEIVFCLEFKVGESRIIEVEVDQVLDYALDLKNFHKFSQDNLIPACCGMLICDMRTVNGVSIVSMDRPSG